MKTPLLLDVPRDSPSRNERITAFKLDHGIETHFTSKMKRKDLPWLACHMPSARKFGYGVTETSSMFDVVSKVGRLLDEAGVLVEGETEREAIRKLCENLEIPFTT